jgi:predicted phage tail component-like protein
MIKESLYFTFAGRKSSEFGILNVAVAAGLYDEPFMANRSIKEYTIRGQEKPLFQEITRESKSLQVSFYFENGWNDELIREVARWLDVEFYQPIIFSEDEEKVYYVLPVDSSSIIHNGLKQGYITLTFRCDSPYSYSHLKVTPWYDLSKVSSSTIEIKNMGDKLILPELFIVKATSGDLKITNMSNKGEVCSFTSLEENEELYVNGDNQIIDSNLPNTWRYDNFNDQYLTLYRGKNILQIDGQCKVKLRYKYKFII